MSGRARPVDVDLRPVTLDDRTLYERTRCDAKMMEHLGGPMPREELDDKLMRDVESTENDETWCLVVTPRGGGEVMGTIALWQHEQDGERSSEIGWMVLPEHQGKGIGRAAAALALRKASEDGRWGVIHAYPPVTNGPSNGICRSLGFTLVATLDYDYNGHLLRCNDWRIDPDERP